MMSCLVDLPMQAGLFLSVVFEGQVYHRRHSWDMVALIGPTIPVVHRCGCSVEYLRGISISCGFFDALSFLAHVLFGQDQPPLHYDSHGVTGSNLHL